MNAPKMFAPPKDDERKRALRAGESGLRDGLADLIEILRTDPAAHRLDVSGLALRLWVRGVRVPRP